MSERFSHFPADFVWGVATASYQIEGAHNVDGRGPGNWDVFCQRPGAIFEGHTGDVACDHYHRLEEDLDLIAGLGVSAYRFGVSWSRILPEGIGAVNEAGISFYERLVDGLLARGITPYLTLFHWDYPNALERLGGWRNPNSPSWFESFTRIVVERLGDRVQHWLTLNEPHAPIEGGLRQGRHAPGMQLPLSDVLLAGHHMLMAHGLATQVIRAGVKNSFVAMAPVLVCGSPQSDSKEDVEAARRWTFSMRDTVLRSTTWWMDPAFGLGYPEDGLSQMGSAMPSVPAADMDLIAQPLDAVGFNLYDTVRVRADKRGVPEVCVLPPGIARTAFDWPVTPEGHFYGPLFAHERYKKPVLITENGLSNRDHLDRNGQVNDAPRVDYIDRHLSELNRAAESVPVQGYFHWSLLDNFEWNHGYRERFGLIHVDYKTMQRTPKASYHHYKKLIASQAE